MKQRKFAARIDLEDHAASGWGIIGAADTTIGCHAIYIAEPVSGDAEGPPTILTAGGAMQNRQSVAGIELEAVGRTELIQAGARRDT
jgi:hypothetical protein